MYRKDNKMNLNEAEKEYREAIRINPNYAEAHNNLGNSLYNLGRYDEAEPEIHYNLEDLLRKMKKEI